MLPDIVTVISFRKVRCAGHISHVENLQGPDHLLDLGEGRWVILKEWGVRLWTGLMLLRMVSSIGGACLNCICEGSFLVCYFIVIFVIF